MAKYKVWLTVKDRYGTVKEIDGGNIETPVYVPDVTSDDKLAYTLERGKTEEYLEFDLKRLIDNGGEVPDPGETPEVPDTPDTPDIPDTPGTVVTQIVSGKFPMYQIGTNGRLEEVKYSYNRMTSGEAAEAPVGPCFYQIVDNGDIIESGYQQFTSYENELFYMIALPSFIQIRSDRMRMYTKIWDAGASEWTATSPDLTEQLTCNLEQIQAVCTECGVTVPKAPDNYTLWANLEAVNNGEKFRFVIEEVDS